MRKIPLIPVLLTVPLLLAACSGTPEVSPAKPEGEKQLLGRFYTEVDPATGIVKTVPVPSQGLNQTSFRSLLSANEGIYGGVVPRNCSSPDWNPVTNTLSLNFGFKNVTDTNSTYFPLNTTFLAPMEFRLTGMYESSCGIPIVAINTDLGPANAPNCGKNGMTLSLCDADGNGCFDSIMPDTTPPDYSIAPGWYFGDKLGPDNQLTPGEESDCNFMQFTLGYEQAFGFYYDVVGYVYDPLLAPPPPTVDPVTSPTNQLTQTITGGCQTGATVSIDGGQETVAGPCLAGAYSLIVTLWPNGTNSLLVSQSSGAHPSVPRSVEITHDDVAPNAIGSSPQEGEANVSVKRTVQVLFSEVMAANTFVDRSTVFLDRTGVCGAAPVNGTASFSADGSQLIFHPNVDLAPGCSYLFQVRGAPHVTAAADPAGNRLAASFSAGFSTVPSEEDHTPPQVVSAFVADNASDVSRSAHLNVLFSEPVQAGSVTATDCNSAGALPNVALVDEFGGVVPVTYGFSGDGTQVDLRPTAALAPMHPFSLIVSACVKDLAGNPLSASGQITSAAYSGTETYHLVNSFFSSFMPDVTPPVLEAVIPNLASFGVSTAIRPRLVYSEPIDSATVGEGNLFLTLQGNPAKIASGLRQEPGGQVVSLTPFNLLSPGVTYEIHATAGVADYEGNVPLSASTSVFQTDPSADSIAPTVVKVTPENGATWVSPYTNVDLWFSEPMNPVTVNNSAIQLWEGNDPIYATVSLAADRQKVTITAGKITPGGTGLKRNWTYTVRVNQGSGPFAQDHAGNNAVPFLSTFVPGNDIVVPTVLSTVPANGATGVSPSAMIAVAMSEPVDPTTVTSEGVKVEYKDSGSCQQGGVWQAISSPRLAVLSSREAFTVNPYGQLPVAKLVRVRLPKNKIKDLKGNGLNEVRFCFQTGTGQDVVPPMLSSVVPADGSVNQPKSTDVTLTFSEPMDVRTLTADAVFLIDAGGSPVAASLSYGADGRTVTLDPAGPLSAGEDYTVYVTTSVRDISGNRLGALQSACFSTDATPCP